MASKDRKEKEPGIDDVRDDSAYEGRKPEGRSSVDRGAMTPIGHGGAAAPTTPDDPFIKSVRREGGGKTDE